MIKRIYSLMIASFVLMGCAMPGRDALVENGIRDRLELRGSQEAIAACVTKTLDAGRTPRGLRAPVTRTTHFNGSLELQAGNPVSINVLIWVATFTELSPNSTSVDLIVRKDDRPLFSDDWVFKEVREVVTACAQEA
jgi:hypothetical protein